MFPDTLLHPAQSLRGLLAKGLDLLPDALLHSAQSLCGLLAKRLDLLLDALIQRREALIKIGNEILVHNSFCSFLDCTTRERNEGA